MAGGRGTGFALDDGQARVVAHRGGRLIVRGGPGSGKTTALAAALAARAAREPAGTVIGLTGDRRAAAALRADVARRTGSGLLPVVGTVHSLAFSLVRGWRPAGADAEIADPRLLSGAEEDVRMRELLLGAVLDGDVDWPDDLRPALSTLGLANEVRAFLARMRERGVGPGDLRRAENAPPVWAALADFAVVESQVMALENVVDYPELLDLARRIVEESPEHASAVRAVYVDSAQDLDVLQIRLLDALVAGGADLVAAGDLDQAILGFRGSVPDLIRGGHGEAEITLSGGYRCSPAVLSTARRVLSLGRHIDEPLGGGEPGIEVRGFASSFDLGAQVAVDLRRWALGGSAESPPGSSRWSDAAVIVRSASQVDALRRALEAGGVPVVAHAGDIPLAAEPAVRVLLDAVAAAIAPEDVTAQGALDLVLGPLVAVDIDDVRSMVRSMVREGAASAGAPPRLADAVRAMLMAAMTGDAMTGDGMTGEADVPAAASAIGDLGRVLRAAAARSAAGDPPAAVLWEIWAADLPRAQPWHRRLRDAALAGDVDAHRDLDAVLALFATAERVAERLDGVAGTSAFVAALLEQRVPAEPIVDRSPRRDAVEILTVHRAAGREWDHVIVVGAQEGAWPARSGAGSLLRRELLEGAPAMRTTALLAEERRLLYVALTRARRASVLAVVDSDAASGEQPSRFVDDLAIPVRPPEGPPPRPETLDGLVGELRTVAEDPTESAERRAEAVAVLGMLAAQVDESGRPLVPAAHPDSWWGLAAATGAAVERPVDSMREPIEVSPSQIDTVLECPLRWFLQRRARGASRSAPAATIGTLVHALAEAVGRGDLPADPDVLDAALEQVWASIPFAAEWESESGRAWVRDALARFCAYHATESRELIAVEKPVRVEIDLDDRSVHIRGMIDRLEQDADGRLVPVDLKTSATVVSRAAGERHRQLALYQLALEDADTHLGGAELLYVRHGSLDMPRVISQSPLPEADADSHADVDRRRVLLDDIATAVDLMRGPEFPPCVGYHCRRCEFRRVCPAHEGSGIEIGSSDSDEGDRP